MSSSHRAKSNITSPEFACGPHHPDQARQRFSGVKDGTERLPADLARLDHAKAHLSVMHKLYVQQALFPTGNSTEFRR